MFYSFGTSLSSITTFSLMTLSIAVKQTRQSVCNNYAECCVFIAVSEYRYAECCAKKLQMGDFSEIYWKIVAWVNPTFLLV